MEGESFFKAVETLLYNQILSVIRASLRDYLSIFDFDLRPDSPAKTGGAGDVYEIRPNAPRFLLKLNVNQTLKNGDIEVQPPFSEITDAIIEGLDNIINSIEAIPHLKDILQGPFSAEIRQKVEFNAECIDKGVKPESMWDAYIRGGHGDSNDHSFTISPEAQVVTAANRRLRRYADNCLSTVKDFITKYDKYQRMFRPETEKELEAFFSVTHTFEEYSAVNFLTVLMMAQLILIFLQFNPFINQEIERYRAIQNEIFSHSRTVDLPSVQLHCEELHKALAAQALAISNRFLDKIIKMTAEHEKEYV